MMIEITYKISVSNITIAHTETFANTNCIYIHIYNFTRGSKIVQLDIIFSSYITLGSYIIFYLCNIQQ